MYFIVTGAVCHHFNKVLCTRIGSFSQSSVVRRVSRDVQVLHKVIMYDVYSLFLWPPLTSPSMNISIHSYARKTVWAHSDHKSKISDASVEFFR